MYLFNIKRKGKTLEIMYFFYLKNSKVIYFFIFKYKKTKETIILF